jgi:sugar phosphate isomerase/epimerase
MSEKSRPTLSRRAFMQTAAGVWAAAQAARATSVVAAPLGLPIGSQTYPHRAMIKAGDFAGLLKVFVEIGVEAVELCSPIGYAEFAPLADGKAVKGILADHGLTCVSGHFSMQELRERQVESIAWAQDVGITQMITATLGGGKRADPRSSQARCGRVQPHRRRRREGRDSAGAAQRGL